jgi:hypothetical protein
MAQTPLVQTIQLSQQQQQQQQPGIYALPTSPTSVIPPPRISSTAYLSSLGNQQTAKTNAVSQPPFQQQQQQQQNPSNPDASLQSRNMAYYYKTGRVPLSHALPDVQGALKFSDMIENEKGYLNVGANQASLQPRTVHPLVATTQDASPGGAGRTTNITTHATATTSVGTTATPSGVLGTSQAAAAAISNVGVKPNAASGGGVKVHRVIGKQVYVSQASRQPEDLRLSMVSEASDSDSEEDSTSPSKVQSNTTLESNGSIGGGGSFASLSSLASVDSVVGRLDSLKDGSGRGGSRVSRVGEMSLLPIDFYIPPLDFNSSSILDEDALKFTLSLEMDSAAGGYYTDADAAAETTAPTSEKSKIPANLPPPPPIPSTEDSPAYNIFSSAATTAPATVVRSSSSGGSNALRRTPTSSSRKSTASSILLGIPDALTIRRMQDSPTYNPKEDSDSHTLKSQRSLRSSRRSSVPNLVAVEDPEGGGVSWQMGMSMLIDREAHRKSFGAKSTKSTKSIRSVGSDHQISGGQDEVGKEDAAAEIEKSGSVKKGWVQNAADAVDVGSDSDSEGEAKASSPTSGKSQTSQQDQVSTTSSSNANMESGSQLRRASAKKKKKASAEATMESELMSRMALRSHLPKSSQELGIRPGDRIIIL